MSDAAGLLSLIPREVLFGNPERINPQISPDGKYLSYIAPDDHNVLQVWLRTPGQQDDQMLTADKKRGIHMYFWAYDGEQLIYLQDADGDENWHLYAVNIMTHIVRDITPFQGIQAQMVALEPQFPHEALVGMNLNDRRKHDVYRINLRNGAIEFDTENPGNVIAWTTDAQFKVRAALATALDGSWDLMVRETAAAEWRVARHWSADEEGYAVTFSSDGATLYIVGSHDANTTRLIALDIASGAEAVIAEDPQYDISRLLIEPRTRVIQAVSFYRDRLEWQVLDQRLAGDFTMIDQVRDGQFEIGSRDLDDHTWLVAYTTDDGPIYYYTYDRSTRTSQLLFSHQPKLEDLPLAPMKPIAYQTRDGLTIHGYLTIPVSAPAHPLPTTLLVHGGPWGRDVWGYNSIVQWLADRGFAVLQVNFRGSAGYGKAFLNAGNREWAGKMHDDLIDGVKWLIEIGVADPKKIAILGGSYGGYAALVGLTFTPDLFAAGVSIVGPSNLLTLLRSIPPYWEPLKKMFAHRVGDVEAEEEFLKSRSPLFFVDRIRAPLLIAQGANDPRVKQAESEQIVEAMRQVGKPVDYILYTDEGHGFVRPENNLHCFACIEAFFARHLGSRCEPLGAIAGHAGEVR